MNTKCIKKYLGRITIGLILISISALAYADWSTFRYDSNRSGHNPSQFIGVPLELKWNNSFLMPGVAYSSPSEVNKIICIGNLDGKFYAFDSEGGTISLQIFTKGNIYSSPPISNGIAYFGSTDGNLYAVDLTTGNTKWVFNTGGNVNSSPVVYNNTLYFGSNDGNLYALNATNGDTVWVYNINDYLWSSPAIADGIVYIGSYNGCLYAIDTTSGVLKWSYQTGCSIRATPAVVSGVAYISSYDGKIYAIDTGNSTLGNVVVKWISDNLDRGIASSPAVGPNLVYVGSASGYLYALNCDTGSIKWQVQACDQDYPIYSSPAVCSNLIFIGGTDGKVYAFDATNGDSVWSYNVGAPIESSIAISNGWIYFESEDGKLWAFRTLDIQPPRTSIHIGEPKYGDTPVFVASATTFTLNAVDDLVEIGDSIGLGVAKTEYRLGTQIMWNTYTVPFTIAGEGEHKIYYHSIDNAGNIESVNTFTVIVDNTPPTTTLEVSEPKYITIDGRIWVNTFTLFTITAYDTDKYPIASGIKNTFHRIDDGEWNSNTSPFPIGSLRDWLKGYLEGEHRIEYYSIDNLNNTEETKSITVFVDYTPPKTRLEYTQPHHDYGDTLYLLVSSSTLFILTPEDTGSGVKRSEYTIDDRLPYNIYTVPFNIPSETFTYGIHPLSYYSIDNVSNKEKENTKTIFLDNIAPVAKLISPSKEDYGLCKVINNETIPITGTASDDYFSNYRIEFRKDIESETQWTIIIENAEQKENQELTIWDIKGLTEGWYILKLTVYDRVNNTTIDTTSIYIGKPKILLTIGKQGKEQAEFNHPYGIAITSQDDTQRIYITDANNDRIQVFDTEGNFLFLFGKKGKGQGEFNKPTGIAISSEETPVVYVADRDNDRIQKFDINGNFIREFGSDILNKPAGVSIDKDNNVYVADRNNDRIMKFNKEGIKLNEFTGFNKPEGVFVDSENNIYVTDRNNDRVVKINQEGTVTLVIAGLNKPISVVTNDRGYIYVSNTNSDSIVKFDKYGNLIMKFSSVNSDSPFNKPAGLAIDSNGNLFIVDENNARIIKVGIPDTSTVAQGSVNSLACPMLNVKSITDAYAWPCPFKPSLGHTVIHFSNLTSNVILRIYNIAGELIFEKSALSGSYDWPVWNNFNEPVASGVYIYFLTDDTKEKKIGKIVIIR